MHGGRSKRSEEHEVAIEANGVKDGPPRAFGVPLLEETKVKAKVKAAGCQGLTTART